MHCSASGTMRWRGLLPCPAWARLEAVKNCLRQDCDVPSAAPRHLSRRLACMSSTPHSAHRPPAPPPIAFGNVYPKGDIMAVVHDRATAQLLVGALQASGFPETDMDILEPAFVLEAAQKLARRRGWLARLGSMLG